MGVSCWSFLKAGGNFVMAEFHPFIWTFDDDLTIPTYSYFNKGRIEDVEEGSYADSNPDLKSKFICWNHGLSEVMNALKDKTFA